MPVCASAAFGRSLRRGGRRGTREASREGRRPLPVASQRLASLAVGLTDEIAPSLPWHTSYRTRLVNLGFKSQAVPMSLRGVTAEVNAYGGHDVSLPSGRELASVSRGLPPVELRVVRELVSDDLPALLEAPAKPPGPAPRPLEVLKGHHHRLAQLVALGKPLVEISAITGKSPSWISSIQRDPTFAALVEHYVGITELQFVDVVGKMRDAGLEALEQLHEALESQPESFTHRERLEIIDKLLVSPMNAQAKIASANASMTSAANIPPISIVFRGPSPEPLDPFNVIEGVEVK